MSAFGPPPLPPGWTEHVGPGGQPYYYHAASQQSTYVRPLPAFPIVPLPTTTPPKKKKEKPLVKTVIPGTEWLRVTTTEGNTFYTHKGRKESVWVVPDEIKEALLELERAEVQEAEQARREQQNGDDEATKMEQEMKKEVERVKAEVRGFVKRRLDEPEPLDEVVISKKARMGADSEDEAESGEGEGEGDQTGEDEDGSDSDDDWQKEAEAQLAAEAEEEKRRQEEEDRRIREVEETETRSVQEQQQLNMPDRVDLSLDEAKALFKTLLREKDINPLHPWDTSLPLFISDPRYVLLPSVSARRDAFDEYCRDRARELRQESVKKEKTQMNPKEEFDTLLIGQVKSTRTVWLDFRRAWKKDRRFYGWGRDDREREKRFKEHLRELGERKRAAAEKAEADFFALLRESGIIEPDSVWKNVKRKLIDDPRYDAVGSSTLREELFNAFLKACGPDNRDQVDQQQSGTSTDKRDVDRNRHEKRERALKEREEQVKAQRGRTEAEIGKSRLGLSKEEDERVFRTLLTDAIRDPQLSWDAVLPQLRTDPRLRNTLLPRDQQLHFFHSHMRDLRSKHLTNLHALFSAHTSSLAASFPQLPHESIEKSLPATKLGFDSQELEKEFDKWQRERTSEARKAFDEMLSENAFVEFWGRFRKMGGEGVDGGVAAEDMGEDEGEGFGGKVDMKALAKNVDLEEITKVLKNDKRYMIFEHVPDQRERWIRHYLATLSAPKLSVHV